MAEAALSVPARVGTAEDHLDLIVSAVVTTATVIGFVAFSEQCRHWMVLPVALCGSLIGIDAVAWLRGRVDVFDPVGIVGLLGMHFFFLSFLLAAAWGEWLPLLRTSGPIIPLEWRDWAGGIALLNAGGLLLYRAVRHWVAHRAPPARRFFWQIERKRLLPLLAGAMVTSLVLQAWVFGRSGGLLGLVSQSRLAAHGVGGAGGMWVVFAFSEIFPVLLMMALAVLAQNRPALRSWAVIIPVVVVVFLLQLVFFGGLRGERSSTVWALFWALGMVHFFIRRMPRGLIYAALAVLLVFMYVYGFYKGLAKGGAGVLTGTVDYEEFERRSGRGIESVLLMDLSRADVQSLILSRVMRPESDYELAWGRTYLGALAQFIPPFVWPDRPPTKVKEGTEVLYGAGTFDPDRKSSKYVYGLAGEAMLNFGALGVPLSFAVYGLLLGHVRRRLLTWPAGDARLLALPLLVAFSLVALEGDSSVCLFFLFMEGLVPLTILILGSRRIPLPAEGSGTGV